MGQVYIPCNSSDDFNRLLRTNIPASETPHNGQYEDTALHESYRGKMVKGRRKEGSHIQGELGFEILQTIA
jgi:hypothetical protein